jgi:hypothetical protein
MQFFKLKCIRKGDHVVTMKEILSDTSEEFKDLLQCNSWKEYFKDIKSKIRIFDDVIPRNIIKEYFSIIIDKLIQGEIIILPLSTGCMCIIVDDKYKLDINTSEVKWIIHYRPGLEMQYFDMKAKNLVLVGKELSERIDKEVQKDCTRYMSMKSFSNTMANRTNKVDVIINNLYANNV